MTDDPTTAVLPAAERLVCAIRDHDGEAVAAAFDDARTAVPAPYRGDTVLACTLAAMVPDPRRTPVEMLLAWTEDQDTLDEDEVDEDREDELLTVACDRTLSRIARGNAVSDLITAYGYTPEGLAHRMGVGETFVCTLVRESRRARGLNRPIVFGRRRGDGRPKPPAFTVPYIHELVERAMAGDLDFPTMINQLREDLNGWEPITTVGASASPRLVELVAEHDRPGTTAVQIADRLGITTRAVERVRRIRRDNPDLIDVA